MTWVAHVVYHACRTLRWELLQLLLETILDAASELPRSATAAGGEAKPQTSQEATRAAASSADDAQREGSTPPGAASANLPCDGIGQCHGSCSSAANYWTTLCPQHT